MVVVRVPEGHADLPDRPGVAHARREVVAVDRREGLGLLLLPPEVLLPLPSLHMARAAKWLLCQIWQCRC